MLDMPDCLTGSLLLRPARLADRAALDALRERSLSAFMDPLLTAPQRATLRELTALDPRLIEDGTYYVVELDGRIAASGGWSRRAALYRQPDADARTDRVRDPHAESAGIRAMYTDPDFARGGLAGLLLQASEIAARRAGFRRAELLATEAGERLYRARGWQPLDRLLIGPADTGIPGCLMTRALG